MSADDRRRIARAERYARAAAELLVQVETIEEDERDSMRWSLLSTADLLACEAKA